MSDCQPQTDAYGCPAYAKMNACRFGLFGPCLTAVYGDYCHKHLQLGVVVLRVLLTVIIGHLQFGVRGSLILLAVVTCELQSRMVVLHVFPAVVICKPPMRMTVLGVLLAFVVAYL